MIESGPADLMAFFSQKIKEPPEGAKTSHEWADDVGKSYCVVLRHLNKCVESGIMQVCYAKKATDKRPRHYYWFTNE